MKPLASAYRARLTSKAAAGSTLSEILVALLVMSIGVISVATLFPISVLRTVQATQLTQAAQLRYNFEGMLGPRPDLLNGTTKWKAQTGYPVGALVVPNVPGNFYLECTSAGTSGSLEPSWRGLGNTTTDGGAEWSTHRLRTYIVDPLGWEERGQEMADFSVAPALGVADLRNTFGRLDLSNTVLPMDVAPAGFYRIARFRGGVLPPGFLDIFPCVQAPTHPMGTLVNSDRLADARRTATLPDNWTLQADTFELVFDPTDATTRSNIVLTNAKTELVQTLDVNGSTASGIDFRTPPYVTVAGEESYMVGRMVAFDETGRRSEVRTLDTITVIGAGQEQLTFRPPLPAAGFTPARVRVETFTPRFTWMLACRRIASGATYSSLVVFYNRSFTAEDELIHPAHFTTAFKGPDNTLGTVDDIPNSRVVVQFNADLGPTVAPPLKRGGYICDAENNRWYRITDYDLNNDVTSPAAVYNRSPEYIAQALDPDFPGGVLSNSASTRCALVTLESPILENSGLYRPVAAANQNAAAGAIIMQGIVDVYQLDPSLPWE
ncbi:MAG: hypothetical protein KF777_06215 [Planctomycetaceae bacterium]|nr:hypothetical protein [Planctomycetaceae bacterium]